MGGKVNMNKIIIGILIFLMLLIPTVNSLSYDRQKIKISSIGINDLAQNDDVLTRNHIFSLIKSYVFIKDYKIKNIIKNIVIDLIFTGVTSLDEIQEILDSCGKTVNEIYLFAEIETSKQTDGFLDCYPGNFRTHFGGYDAKGSYIRYSKEYYDALYGWNLKINGEDTKRNSGYFFGYNGYVRHVYEWAPPGEYYHFILDGSAILTFHGA
jgi:hypothetical protein